MNPEEEHPNNTQIPMTPYIDMASSKKVGPPGLTPIGSYFGTNDYIGRFAAEFLILNDNMAPVAQAVEGSTPSPVKTLKETDRQTDRQTHKKLTNDVAP